CGNSRANPEDTPQYLRDGSAEGAQSAQNQFQYPNPFGNPPGPRSRLARAHNSAYRVILKTRKRQGRAYTRRMPLAIDLSPGDRAPAFRLQTDDGEVSTTVLKGRPFVVYFYPKDDTSGCTKEAISFSEERKKFESLGIAVIGISRDSV